MDLTSLYELRERLKTGTIAGTELVSGDFRLKRAIEAFEPFCKASPVFGKIGQLSKAVMAENCPDRAAALLDALTLVDAVLCTQGAVAVQGEIEPVLVENWGTAVTNAPYSVLANLLEALTSSGSGHYSVVMETHEQHPELFKDYRVKSALVKALGASYGELADQVARWLTEDGTEIVPLLKQGFDPKGKKEMARRVKVIDALAGAEENDFYLSQLESAEKEVKQALIYALRHSGDNAKTLLELVKTEKGSAKNTARYALAQLEDPEVWDYWKAVAVKNPGDLAEFLLLSTGEKAGELTGKELLKAMEPFVENGKSEPLKEKTAVLISRLFQALPGKSGPVVCQCFRTAALLGSVLDRKAEGIEGTWMDIPALSSKGFYKYEAEFSLAVPYILQQALLVNPEEDLMQLALELYDRHGQSYLPAALTVLFLTKDSRFCYQWIEPMLEKKMPLGTKQPKEFARQIEDSFLLIEWEQGQFVFKTTRFCQAEGRHISYIQPLKEPLDERFYDLLMRRGKNHMDEVLAQWIQPENRPLCEKLGKYFYDRALVKSNCQPYLKYMRECGWRDCTGLLPHYCSLKKDIHTWDLLQFLEEMPGDPEQKAIEAEKICVQAEKGSLKLKINAAQVQLYITKLRTTGHVF